MKPKNAFSKILRFCRKKHVLNIVTLQLHVQEIYKEYIFKNHHRHIYINTLNIFKKYPIYSIC